MDIQTASYEELKAARDEINARLRDVEKQTIEELEARAAQFGLALVRQEPQRQKRKRRTREEVEAARNGYETH